MKHHIYQFNGVKRVTRSGSATGLDETGELADTLMLWWDREFLKRLDELNILVDLFTRFKDDTSIITEVTPLALFMKKAYYSIT